MSQQHPIPATVAVSTSTATNAHLRSKAPKWLKDAAYAARTVERGSKISMVMDLSVANARKAATWLTAEADRLVAGEAAAEQRRLARRLRTVAGRVPKAIEKVEKQAATAPRRVSHGFAGAPSPVEGGGALPSPPPGSQVGLTAWGRSTVEFTDFVVVQRAARAFVVMQFGEPYDTLYREVIRPVSEETGFDPYRADDMSGPGIILEDIISGIREAAVIIAEITPVNANVFYELGYAHATDKPSILLAEKGQRLPFDVSGFRCIFYDDSIGGKRRVESELRRHLESLR